MKYSFKCPADEYTVSVDAANDDEALQKIMEASKDHATTAHADVVMPMDQVVAMVRAGITRA